VPGIARVRLMLSTARTSSRSPVPDTSTTQYPSSGPDKKIGPIVTASPGRTTTAGAGFAAAGETQGVSPGEQSGLPSSAKTAKPISKVLSLTLTALQLKVSQRRRIERDAVTVVTSSRRQSRPRGQTSLQSPASCE
jgi:hypothetical protein